MRSKKEQEKNREGKFRNASPFNLNNLTLLSSSFQDKMPSLQEVDQLITLGRKYIVESFKEMYPTIEEKREIFENEDDFLDVFIYQATERFDETGYNFYEWMGDNDIDIDNITAQFILEVLLEVDEYFVSTYGLDNRIDIFTSDYIINKSIIVYVNNHLDELKEMCNQLIYDDNDAHDNTDSENEYGNEIEELPIV